MKELGIMFLKSMLYVIIILCVTHVLVDMFKDKFKPQSKVQEQVIVPEEQKPMYIMSPNKEV